jgi:hypothetical protein
MTPVIKYQNGYEIHEYRTRSCPHADHWRWCPTQKYFCNGKLVCTLRCDKVLDEAFERESKRLHELRCHRH